MDSLLLSPMRRLFCNQGKQQQENSHQQQQQGKGDGQGQGPANPRKPPKASSRPFAFLRRANSGDGDKHRQKETQRNGLLVPPLSVAQQSHHQQLAPSRTFDGAHQSPQSAGTADWLSVDPGSSLVGLSCCQQSGASAAVDGQLDKSLMQTCTDVKYENRRRPKFAAVVDANFQRQCLQAHNLVRQVYGCPSLQWSQELAELAKTWALKLAERGRLLYPELPGIGENIFLLAGQGTGDHLTTGTELVAQWAAEATRIDLGRPSWSERSQHFSQLVWRSSAEMGVARHWNTGNDCLAIVAFYRPAGNSNLPGEFAANLPAKEDVPEGAVQMTGLSALAQALNRTDLGDGGFRKGGPLPPPNTTKILK